MFVISINLHFNVQLVKKKLYEFLSNMVLPLMFNPKMVLLRFIWPHRKITMVASNICYRKEEIKLLQPRYKIYFEKKNRMPIIVLFSVGWFYSFGCRYAARTRQSGHCSFGKRYERKSQTSSSSYCR